MKPEPVNLLDYQKIVDDYHKESDRAAIVLAGSFVEHYLASYLKHFVIEDKSVKDLFAGFVPFATFDQRISTAYAFKLISSEIRDDLIHIKRIRNHFAHSPRSTSLSDAAVQDHFAKLSTAIDPAYNAEGNGPLKDKRLIYLFAVGIFVVFAHNIMQKYSRSIIRT